MGGWIIFCEMTDIEYDSKNREDFPLTKGNIMTHAEEAQKAIENYKDETVEMSLSDLHDEFLLLKGIAVCERMEGREVDEAILEMMGIIWNQVKSEFFD